MRRLGLSLVALVLVAIGCTTATERIPEAAEPAVSASTTALPETATTTSTTGVEASKPARDTLGQPETEQVDEADADGVHARDEEATQVTQQPTPTSAPEPLQERHPTIEAGRVVNWVGIEASPEWPFDGLVQLTWVGEPWRDEGTWRLRFYQWTDSGVGRGWTISGILLPDLSVDCVGDIGLVSHGPEGIEIGGPAESASPSFLLPWGGVPERLDGPSDELLEEVQSRPSNIDADVVGDIVSIAHGDASLRFALREPARTEGDWWNVQARHDGDVFVVTVHPTRHPCFSGVTWLSAAATGEMLWCGTDTAATRFIASDPEAAGPLVLPAAEEYPVVLACPYPLGP